MGNTLTLSLKRKWFDMIAAGIKKEEYRERTPYWHKRLNHPFDIVEFTLGYPPKGETSRRMRFKIEKITIGAGVPEWGAAQDTTYFVIKLGERL